MSLRRRAGFGVGDPYADYAELDVGAVVQALYVPPWHRPAGVFSLCRLGEGCDAPLEGTARCVKDRAVFRRHLHPPGHLTHPVLTGPDRSGRATGPLGSGDGG